MTHEPARELQALLDDWAAAMATNDPPHPVLHHADWVLVTPEGGPVNLERRGVTLMEITSAFSSLEAMGQLLAMGMDTGPSAAIDQIDGLLPTGRA